MTNELQNEMYDFFCDMSGEAVISFLTNKLGMQILNDWMANEMQDELGFEPNLLEDDEEDNDEDEDEEDNEDED